MLNRRPLKNGDAVLIKLYGFCTHVIISSASNRNITTNRVLLVFVHGAKNITNSICATENSVQIVNVMMSVSPQQNLSYPPRKNFYSIWIYPSVGLLLATLFFLDVDVLKIPSDKM